MNSNIQKRVVWYSIESNRIKYEHIYSNSSRIWAKYKHINSNPYRIWTSNSKFEPNLSILLFARIRPVFTLTYGNFTFGNVTVGYIFCKMFSKMRVLFIIIGFYSLGCKWTELLVKLDSTWLVKLDSIR